MQARRETVGTMLEVAWRAMTPADLRAVLAVAAEVHPDYPEDEAVFAERLRLSPEGCLCLAHGERLAGYVVSHRWTARTPPALNSLLGAIPPAANDWYLHDIALLPGARGTGAAGLAVEKLVALARDAGCARLALVAVNGSSSFWRRQGFRVVHDASLARKLASYDDAACYMERDLTR